jgi:glyoxylase-like metal-dependent hydrolase (beta-lactamase superfamily II)
MDMAKMFPSAPPDELQEALRAYKIDPNDITFSYNCLFVDTEKQRILVDVGIGREQEGKLLSHLEAEKIAPESITQVIITHGHADHIGGLTDAQGNLVFKNAEYWIWHDEWKFWNDERNLKDLPPHAVAAVQKNFPAIANKINLVDREHEFLPGVSVIHVPGHTAGMMALQFESHGKKLLAVADSFHRPFQIGHLTWNVSFDRIPEEAPKSRQKLLKLAVADHALVLPYHFPHPGLGRVKAQGKSWEWEPI